MISFVNNSSDEPYKKLLKLYKKALATSNQYAIEALYISSFSKTLNEVDSRLVNLKIVDDKELIFFTNYNSAKSIQFSEHQQISAVIFWNSINVQVRMKSTIKKTSLDFNKNYFLNRSAEKNALAISSNQSKKIDSYNTILEKYKETLKQSNLKDCPQYWGGYSFSPYYFEFWEGHEFRLNKRDVYQIDNDKWQHFILQP